MAFIAKKVVTLVPVLVLTWLILNARYAWGYRTVGTTALIEPVLNILPLYLFILVDMAKRHQKSWFQVLVQATFYVYILAVWILTVFFVSFRQDPGKIWFKNLLGLLSIKFIRINLVPFTIFNEYHIFDEYSGADYTACPVVGNRHSGIVETAVPELETV